MSQIVGGYILSTSLINRLGDLERKDDQKSFSRELQCGASDTLSEYKGDGSTYLVLVEYLDSIGLGLPIHTTSPGSRVLSRKEGTLALIGDLPAAIKLLGRMNEFEFNLDKLRLFYEGFNEVTAPEAGVAMMEALKYLKRGLTQLKLADDWYYLTIG